MHEVSQQVGNLVQHQNLSPLAYKNGSTVITHSPGKDLAGAGRLLVDEHCQGCSGQGGSMRNKRLVPDMPPALCDDHSSPIWNTSQQQVGMACIHCLC